MELMERRRILLNTPHIDIVTGLQFVTDMVAPLESLVINFSPIQDLNGYDNPWPAGGGKNLFNIEDLILASSTFSDGVLSDTASNFASAYTESNPFTVNLPAPVTISLKGKHEGTNSDTRGLTLKVLYSDETTGTAVYFSNGNSSVDYTTVTFTSSKDIIGLYFDYGSIGGNVWYIKDFQIELGSTATGYAPYSNVCPITGWTGMNVTRTGKNLIDESKLLLASGWTVTNGVYSGVNLQLHYAFMDGFPNLKFKEDTRYCVSLKFRSTVSGKSTKLIFEYTDGTQTINYMNGTTEQYISLVSDSGKSIDKFRFSYGSSDTVYISELQIEEGSTATSYEAYTGETYSIDWTDEAGTVYGGTLNLITGVLTVTYGVKSFNGGFNKHTLVSNAYYINRGFSDCGEGVSLCNMFLYKNKAFNNLSDGQFNIDTGYTRLCFVSSSFSTATEANAFFAENPLIVCYPLATPRTYQLTPQQIRALKGTNNLFSNSNGGVTVDYWTHLD